MSETATTRKVQRLGGSSLIITLPKQWARRLGIKVGDEIEVIESGGKLLVQPRDQRAEDRAGTVTIRYNGIARMAGVDAIVDCAFVHGYDKVEILIKGLGEADVKRLMAELNASKKVASVERGTDRLTVTLAPSPNLDVARLIKEASSSLQQLLEAAASGAEEAEIRRLEGQALELIESSLRSSKGSDIVDPMAYGVLLALPSMVADSSVVLKGRADLLNKMKEAVGEFLGGLASASGRRLLNAAMIASELRDMALHEGGAAAVVAPLADALLSASMKLICPSILEQEAEGLSE
ncbi:AbrB/MazE/SpoVT family DNA-binding domain-containing protein [Acidilobus sp.]|uniref:AbrB/MazE/SpoVT family DNA-binding domain-containing protein n=1 Tax=Acidilobus sp. TaxID=1872109 RepID=UPI003D0492A6